MGRTSNLLSNIYSSENSTRAQTVAIGVVLVFGLVIASSSVVIVFGSSALDRTEEGLSIQRAEKTLSQLDSQAALVALGSSDTQSVNLPRRTSSQFSIEDGGKITITTTNLTTYTKSEILSQNLGSLIYEEGDTRLAYQGGGVWRQKIGEERSVMISPPEFHFRNGTLTLPVIAVNGDKSISQRAGITFNGSDSVVPKRSGGLRNPLRNTAVNVTVDSQYYRAWGQYFEERTDGQVNYDDSNQRVILELRSPIGQQQITSATASLSAGGEFIIQGNAKSGCSNDGDNLNGDNEMYSNSYNSSLSGDYCDQASNDSLGHQGDIVYGEDVDISFGSGGSWIHGDVVSGENVTVSGSSGSGQVSVYGNINYTSECNPSVADCEARVEKTDAGVHNITGIRKASQINGYVENTLDDVKSDNDNSMAAISGDQLVYNGSGVATLDGGRYYLQNIDIPEGDKLRLNTTSTDVVVAVEENISIRDRAKIEVIGDGIARVYLANHTTSGADALEMDKEAEITNAGDDATQFRLYGKDSMSARIGDGSNSDGPARFVGVIYAPPGSVGSGTIHFKKGELFGGLITSTTIIDNAGGAFHYDEALATEQIIDPGAGVIKVTYLHVSVNRINIRNG